VGGLPVDQGVHVGEGDVGWGWGWQGEGLGGGVHVL
jgi:hypothetical protein